MRELALGLRLAATGGPSTRLRAALTALGVAFGMIVLLTAASVPNMIRAIDARQAARGMPEEQIRHKGPDTLLVGDAGTEFHNEGIRGQLLQPEGPDAPVPPGLRALPPAGGLAVSPGLRDLLRDEPLLRERLDGPIVATIGPAGLNGPRELAYYEGSSALTTRNAFRLRRFGYAAPDEPLPAFMVLILAVGVVVLLLPVAVFIGTAVRFGSDQRDRRLAALRLVGADRAMTVRIAAGEALFGVLGGMVLGAAGFIGLRPLAEHLELQDVSVYAGDIHPDLPLLVLIVAAVPLTTLLASMVALRRVVVEPLGVTRRGDRTRRRLLWRLVPIVLGALILASHGGDLVRGGDAAVAPVATGVGLMLAGITALLPWLVDVAVGRLGGGGVGWQLAVRRMQLDGGTAARAVGGVAVAVAGAIALQTVLAQGQRVSTLGTEFPVRADVRAGVLPSEVSRDELAATLRDTPGVERVMTFATASTGAIFIGGCDDLRELARIGACRNGDAFVNDASLRHTRRVTRRAHIALPTHIRRVPLRSSPDGYTMGGVLLTPAAAGRMPILSVDAFASLRKGDRDAIERVRNAVARISATGNAFPVVFRTELSAYRSVRRGIFAGAYLVLALIAASLLVGGLEQLRERRPVLAALSAFGVPRGVLMRSVLWQAAVPVVLGLLVSVTIGIALAALLLRIGSQPFSADWPAIVAMAGAGAATILLVTLASLPVVTRLMRPEGLRAE